MTKKKISVEAKEESQGRSVVAQLGLSRELKGTHIIQCFVIGKRKAKNLSDAEIEAVLDSWETRYFVPITLIDAKESWQVKVDNVRLERTDGEEECAYKRRKVELIEQYVKTIPS